MWCTIYESIVIGIITLVIGYIILNITKKNEKNEKDNKKSNHVYIVFFMTGFVLHFMFEILGFNKWYCDKKERCSNVIYQVLKS